MYVIAGGKDFFDWLLNLPWKRVGIWGLVGFSAYQLKDFFGVSYNLSCCSAKSMKVFQMQPTDLQDSVQRISLAHSQDLLMNYENVL